MKKGYCLKCGKKLKSSEGWQGVGTCDNCLNFQIDSSGREIKAYIFKNEMNKMFG